MTHLLEWVGGQVRVTFQSTYQVTGELIAVDEFSVVVETQKGPVFVPMTAVMNISPIVEQ